MFSINIKEIKRYFTRSYIKWTLWPKITYWYKYKLHWPIMLRRTMIRRIAELDRYQQNRLQEKDKDLQKEREILDKLIKGLELFKINFEVAGKGNYLGARYRLCVDIDQALVEHCFVHGNSQDEIDYLCKVLTIEIGTEMRRINFKRECYDAQNREYQKRMRPLDQKRYIIDEYGNKREV